MATADGKRSWIKSMSIKSSLTMGEPSMSQNQKGSQMHLKDTRKSSYTWYLHANMMGAIEQDY